MIAWLIDAYRSKNAIALWLKSADGLDFRREYPFESFIYTDSEAIPDLRSHFVPYK
ncbi:MAG: hypothetical protein JNN05_04820, partial [Candidatus Omnitrophica bacterium]|nr:hypothetical protein [Candidatus Omnitrophota bacterium]